VSDKFGVDGLLPISEFPPEPPKQAVSPPVQSRLQVLPLHELGWVHFEYLCRRLIEAEAEPESIRFYGVPGDAQNGIDIYARRKK
jgi:hypothetical protein